MSAPPRYVASSLAKKEDRIGCFLIWPAEYLFGLDILDHPLGYGSGMRNFSDAMRALTTTEKANIEDVR